jgi:hypothetical protein
MMGGFATSEGASWDLLDGVANCQDNALQRRCKHECPPSADRGSPAGFPLEVHRQAVSAALKPGGGSGFHVGSTGLVRAASRDGKVFVHFGALPDAEGWCAADAARPDADLLGQIRPLYSP